MEFLLLFPEPKGAPAPSREGMAEMGKYARELADRRILKRGAPLAAESAAACVRVREGRAYVIDGPFTESKEVIAGFWIIDVPSREAAIEVAIRCPHARHASVHVHRLLFRGDFGDTKQAKPYLLVFRMEPGSDDADGAKGREMRQFGEGLLPDATLFETGLLAAHEPSARVEVRGGKSFITDGPYTESKEVIGGYALVRVADRAAALELAQRFPHARWGPVEVREVLFFDRV